MNGKITDRKLGDCDEPGERPDAESQGFFMPDCPVCGTSRNVIREDIGRRAVSFAKGTSVGFSGGPRYKCCKCRHLFSD